MRFTAGTRSARAAGRGRGRTAHADSAPGCSASRCTRAWRGCCSRRVARGPRRWPARCCRSAISFRRRRRRPRAICSRRWTASATCRSMCCRRRARCSAHAASRPSRAALDERAFRRAVFHGYPDRVGRRRQPGSPRVLLASGHGAVLSAESGVRDGEFLRRNRRPGRPARRGRRSAGFGWRASSIASGWCRRAPRRRTSSIAKRGVSAPSGATTTARSCWPSTRSRPDPEAAAAPAARRLCRAGMDGRRRAARATSPFRRPRRSTCRSCSRAPRRAETDLDDIDLAAHLTWEEQQRLDRAAPPTAGRAERANPRARVPRRRHRVGVRQAAGVVRARRDAARRSRVRSRCSLCCSRRTPGRCRRRVTFEASGSGPTLRCAKNCAADTRSIPGPKIRGPRRRRRERRSGARSRVRSCGPRSAVRELRVPAERGAQRREPRDIIPRARRTMTRRELLALAALVRAPSAATQSSCMAGVATIDITPEHALWMAGFARRSRPSQGVALPLHAKALALRHGRGQPVVLVTADLLGVTARITDRVASAVRRLHGIERADIPVQCEPHALRARGRRAVVGGVRPDRLLSGTTSAPTRRSWRTGSSRSSARLWCV